MANSEDSAAKDLSTVCEEQMRKIANLESQLRAKESEVQSLNTALKRFTSKDALTRPNPLFTVAPYAKPQLQPVPSTDFWESHIDGNEGNELTFEDIAAKGLWILSSATANPAALLRKPAEPASVIRDVYGAVSPANNATTRRRPTPYSPPKDAKMPVQTRPRPGPAPISAERKPTLRLPQIVTKPKLKPPAFKSVSPLKPRPGLPASEQSRVKESGYSAAHSQIRSSLKAASAKPQKSEPKQPSKAIFKGRKASFAPSWRSFDAELSPKKAGKVVHSSPQRVTKDSPQRLMKESPLRLAKNSPAKQVERRVSLRKSMSLSEKKSHRRAS